jgi:polyisoprenoid-binding protein YceI
VKPLLICLALATAIPAAAADTYVIDPHHTFARFDYDHWGYTTVGGRFDKTSGKVTIDTVAQAGSARIVIDAASVSAGPAEFNEHLRSPDFFDAKRYPEITFDSDQFRFQDGKLLALEGRLTIKGITRPVRLDISHFVCKRHPMFKKDYCGANASTKIKRSDFGAGKYAPFVSDDVTINISLEAAKE